MFRRLSNSWQLVKASAEVLRADKELVVFPIVSAIAVLLVTASFIVPIFVVGAAGGEEALDGPLGAIITFALYVATYTVIFFCNSALVGAALIRLRGGDPTVGDGFRIAFAHLPAILGYAVIAATVGMVLRALQERAGFLGKIVIAIAGGAWNVITFLVVPVLVTEKIGPVDAVKRSAGLLKKTWGEQIVGNAAVGTIFGLAMVLLVLLGIPVIVVAVGSGSPALIGLVVGLFVLAFALLAVTNATLSGIYTAAVYRYAADGEVGHTFQADLVEGAFRPK